MKEDIFILIMAITFELWVIEKLQDYIEQLIHTALPEGSKLIDCKEVINPATNKVLEILDSRNENYYVENPRTDFYLEKGLLRITIESEEPLKYKRLPWLEGLLKNFIATEQVIGGIYFPYLIKEEGILKFATPSRYKVEDEELEDVDTDDWSSLNEHAELLNAIYYGQTVPEDCIYKEAKLSLLQSNIDQQENLYTQIFD
jgi:hypothetical protein